MSYENNDDEYTYDDYPEDFDKKRRVLDLTTDNSSSHFSEINNSELSKKREELEAIYEKEALYARWDEVKRLKKIIKNTSSFRERKKLLKKMVDVINEEKTEVIKQEYSANLGVRLSNTIESFARELFKINNDDWLPLTLDVFTPNELLNNLASIVPINTLEGIGLNEFSNMIREYNAHSQDNTSYSALSQEETQRIRGIILSITSYVSDGWQMQGEYLLQLYIFTYNLYLTYETRSLLPILAGLQDYIQSFYSYDPTLLIMAESSMISIKSIAEKMKNTINNLFDTVDFMQETLNRNIGENPAAARIFFGKHKSMMSKDSELLKSKHKSMKQQADVYNVFLTGIKGSKATPTSNNLETIDYTSIIKNLTQEVTDLKTNLRGKSAEATLSESEIQSLQNAQIELTDKITQLNENLKKAERKIAIEKRAREFAQESLYQAQAQLGTVAGRLSDLPDLNEIAKGDVGYELSDIKSPKKIVGIITDQMKRVANSALAAITMARDWGKVIGFNIYRNSHGSFAELTRTFEAVKVAQARLAPFLPPIFVDFQKYPQMLMIGVYNMAAYLGNISPQYFVSQDFMMPGEIKKEFVQTAFSSRDNISKTQSITDSTSKEVEDSLRDEYETKLSEEMGFEESIEDTTSHTTNENENYGVRASVPIWGCSIGANYSKGKNTSDTSTNTHSINNSLNTSVDVMNNVVSNSIHRTNTERSSISTVANENTIQRSQSEGVNREYQNPNFDAMINTTTYQAGEEVFLITTLKDIRFIIITPKNRAIPIRLPELKSELPKYIKSEALETVYKQFDHITSHIMDYQGRLLSAVRKIEMEEGKEYYQMIKDNYINLINDSKFTLNTMDEDYSPLLEKASGIVIEIRQEIQKKSGLIRHVTPQKGTALSEIELQKINNLLNREQMEIEILQEEKKSMIIENTRRDQILDAIIKKEFGLEQARSASFFLLKGREIMDQRLLLNMENNVPKKDKNKFLTLNEDK